jgi:PAS domain S-box-containing protein
MGDTDPGFWAPIDAAPDAMLVVDRDGRMIVANEAAEELFGHAREALIGARVSMLVPEPFRLTHEGKRQGYAEHPVRRPMGADLPLTAVRADGSEIPVEISLSPLVTAEGPVTIAAIRNLTERRVTAAMRRHAAQQEAVAGLGIRALAGHDLGQVGRDAALQLVDHAQADLVEVLLRIPGDEEQLELVAQAGFPPDTVRSQARRAVDGTPAGAAYRGRRPVVGDLGEWADRVGFAPLRAAGAVTTLSVPMLVGDDVVGVIGVSFRTRREIPSGDVSLVQAVANVVAAAAVRLQAEASVSETRALLQAVIDNIPAGVYVKDRAGRYVLGNARFARTVGGSVAAAIGRTDTELFGAEPVADILAHDREVLSTGQPLEFDERFAMPDGVHTFRSLKFPLIGEDGALLGMGGVSTDITDRVRADQERAQLQAQLAQAQRLESVGRLAGGIAHDFNNLLAVILNFARFVADDLPAGSSSAGDVEHIQQAARRAAELTRRLLVFSRRQPMTVESLDLNAVVGDVRAILSRTLGDHIDLRCRCADDLWPVSADRGQIEQVLMNLALNARDAMADGGVLMLATRNALLDADSARAHGGELAAGPYVELSVTDTGSGMSPETLERALEPFFTTKAPELGTGLGLATVYGIVTQLEGRVELYSTPGTGTAVRVTLPATLDGAVAPAAGPRQPGRRGHGERVLLVEDEPAVRSAARRILARAGYEVIEAADGQEGLTVAGAVGGLDAVVSDVRMPGGSGIDFARALRERRPGLGVVLMSGYSEELLMDGEPAWPHVFLDKPFTADGLLEAVHAALTEPS